ncbi:uncharacterized protein Z519_05183 [Cladophialophora bantiana CBS 173.52]|uniref:Uncharacterized protein n=1 Tax=Cladophialophora bantiana (strain ATCC 10958 / CBS 173.52 / CDC B-1940 / NIH 8579) TaxID=1442370 RepID=A0A0D2HKQ7_CLAB1|nr:uncharacterized protein Z519_05183 [Cladophialophora bantiana CBS 173.52]KIW93868.1 hypothetical protein Z519_05183 [Cladophialophora bantiana CBS 173.52]
MPKPTKPLSKARVSDSDEDDESSDVTRAAAPKSASTAAKPSQPKAGKGHTRNVSDNIGSSPHIIINDDDGDLEIDMGSPPPDNGRSRRGRVDPEMFRSHTATPIGGLSSNIGRSSSRPVSKPPVEEPARGRSGRERDRGRDMDRDVTMKDIEGASSGGEDEDVEEFELGSPREKSIVVPNSGDVSRSQDDASEDEDRPNRGRRPQQQQQIDQAPPTPPEPVISHDDDDEDLLEAALEAALEEEDENEDRGIGLGIGMAHGNMQDDESEVSEEE